eukprot:6202709-Pleurochrysis_carterae.AAC.2
MTPISCRTTFSSRLVTWSALTISSCVLHTLRSMSRGRMVFCVTSALARGVCGCLRQPHQTERATPERMEHVSSQQRPRQVARVKDSSDPNKFYRADKLLEEVMDARMAEKGVSEELKVRTAVASPAAAHDVAL